MRGGPEEPIGRAPIVRGPPGPLGRDDGPLGIVRRWPGGGGIGRPDELIGGRGAGGGEMGRPDALMGGRLDAGRPSPSPGVGRCVGRIVVGPSGDTVRTGAGLGGAERVRTTRGASAGRVVVSANGDSTGARSITGATGAATTTGAGSGSLAGRVTFLTALSSG